MTWWGSFRELTPSVQRLLLLGLINNIGIGLAIPIGFLFVRDVLGGSPAAASATVPITAVAGLLSHLACGRLSDRTAPLKVCGGATVISAVGAVSYATAAEISGAYLAAAVTGLGLGASTAWFSTLARVSTDTQRNFSYSVNQLTVNLGISSGLAISALVTLSPSNAAYPTLFALKALAHLLLVGGLVALHRQLPAAATTGTYNGQERRAERKKQTTLGAGGYIKPLVLLAAINFLAMAMGMTQLDSAFVAAVIESPALSDWSLAILLIVNTATVIIFNVMLSPRLSITRPSLLIGLVAPIWASSFSLLALGTTTTRDNAFLLCCTAMIIFSLGEVLFGIALPSLTSSVMPADSIGKAFGLQNAVASVAFIAGPGMTTLLLLHGPPALPLVICAAAILGMIPLAIRSNFLTKDGVLN